MARGRRGARSRRRQPDRGGSSRGSRSPTGGSRPGVGFLTLAGAAAPARGRHLVVGRARLAADPRRLRRGAAVALEPNQRRVPRRASAARGSRPPPRLRPRGGRAAGGPDAHRRAAPHRPGDVYRGGFGVALVLGAALLFLYANGALGAGARRRPRGRRRRARARADPGSVPVAAGPQPRRRAGRADPLAGARRGRRAPPRLGAADADPDAEARRRPARGRDAGPPPGARAARVAVRRRPRDERRQPRRPPSRRPRPRSRTPTASRSTSSPSATASSTSAPAALVAATREALTNAAKFAADAGPIAVYAEIDAAARAGLRPRPRRRLRPGRACPPTAAACASRSSAGWSATAAPRRFARRRDRAPRSS